MFARARVASSILATGAGATGAGATIVSGDLIAVAVAAAGVAAGGVAAEVVGDAELSTSILISATGAGSAVVVSRDLIAMDLAAGVVAADMVSGTELFSSTLILSAGAGATFVSGTLIAVAVDADDLEVAVVEDSELFSRKLSEVSIRPPATAKRARTSTALDEELASASRTTGTLAGNTPCANSTCSARVLLLASTDPPTCGGVIGAIGCASMLTGMQPVRRSANPP